MKNNEIKDKILKILEAERAALLSGDLETVHALADEKVLILKEVEDNPMEIIDHLSEIKPLTVRNQELIEQALSGIQAVSTRISEMRSARTALRTYDASGNQLTLSKSQTSIEKRA